MAVPALFIISLSFLLLCTDATYKGHWEKTWLVPTTSNSDANFGLAFSGWVNPDMALADSAKVYSNLMGDKIITLGGGNGNGAWHHAALQDVNAAIDGGSFTGYHGIAFDVEEGDSDLASAFLETFSKAKQAGYLVVVATSHTAPYGVADATNLMWAFITSTDIDVISPMMYGSEDAFLDCSRTGYLDTISHEVPWFWFQYSQAAVVPSIWRPDQYDTAREFLASQDVKAQGYIAWCA